jgi:hypothetical protein
VLQARLEKLDEERRQIVCELSARGVVVDTPAASNVVGPISSGKMARRIPRALLIGVVVTLIFSGMVVAAASDEGGAPEPTCTGDNCGDAENNEELFDRLDTLYKREQERQVLSSHFIPYLQPLTHTFCAAQD